MEQIIKLLHDGKYTIIVSKNEQVYTSTKRGIAPILDLINTNKELLQDAYVADKVIGKAAALLLIYGGVKQIHADVISEYAIEVLDQHNVIYSFDQKVPYIINRTGTDMCPMERCVLEINEPAIALVSLTEAVERMKT